MFPAQQLGKAFDHYDMARDGIADVTYINPGYQPGRFPIIGAGELPFLMSDAKGGSMALDAWYRKYAEKEMKDVKFCLAFIHSPSSFHSRTKKIVVPDDVKGMKIRPAHATMANFVTQLGGTNVQSSAPEVRDIIEARRRRRRHLPVGLAAAVRHRQGDEIRHGCAALCHDVRLRDEQGQVQPDVRPPEEGDRRQLQSPRPPAGSASTGARFEDAGIDKIKAESGHEVYKLTPEQTGLWKKASEPLVKTWAEGVKKNGVDPDARDDRASRRARPSTTRWRSRRRNTSIRRRRDYPAAVFFLAIASRSERT